MEEFQYELELYGLNNYNEAIDEIINNLSITQDSFDIRMILTEAITNAYRHGNRCDCNKPIHIRYSVSNNMLHIQVEDCGTEVTADNLLKDINIENLLDEGGRGLYLIQCFSDRMVMKNNILDVHKSLAYIG